MKNKLIYIYYLVMVVILALYTNMYASPNVVIRLVYLAAVVAPLFSMMEFLPATMVCLLTISYNTFAFPLMPTEWYYYLLVVGVFSIINREQNLPLNPLFLVVLFYVVLNDLLFTSKLTGLSENLPIFLLLFLCVRSSKLDESVNLLPLAFMIASLVISYWILFRPEARFEVSHVTGDLDAAGWQDPNYLGGVVGMGCVTAMHEFLRINKKGLYRIFSAAILIIALISTASLGSRGAILAVAVGIVAQIFASGIKRRIKLLVLVLAIATVFFMYNYHVFDLLQARMVDTDDISNNRFDIWALKLGAFFNEGNPFNWLFGYGKEGAVILGTPGHPINCHNEFLSVIVRFGIVGFVLFLFAYTFPIRVASKRMRPIVISLLLYQLTVDMTLDSLCFGYWGYLSYFFFVTLYSINTRRAEKDEYSRKLASNER